MIGEEVSLHVRTRCIGEEVSLPVRTRYIAIRLSLRLKLKTSGLSACEPLSFLTPYRLRSLTQFR